MNIKRKIGFNYSEKILGKAKRLCTEFNAIQSLYGHRMSLPYILKSMPGADDRKYYSLLRNLIRERIEPYILNCQLDYKSLPRCNNGPIWVMWWQPDEDSIPPLIKSCLRSIRNHSNGRDVYLISQNNIESFTQIPQQIMDKLKNKTISITAFSDYLRFKLLFENGGIWIDSTVFISKDIPKEINKYQFYSPSRTEVPKSGAFSGKWAIYFLSGVKGLPLFEYTYRFLEEYWLSTNFLIDYFLTDNVMQIVYDDNKLTRDLVNHIPINNQNRFDLQSYLNHTLSSLGPITNTYIHKLTYKNFFRSFTRRGEKTVYEYLIEGSTKQIERLISSDGDSSDKRSE
jgi:hypothetical protein